jgi:hypothetical protein
MQNASGVHALRDDYTLTIEPARALAAEILTLEHSFTAQCRTPSDSPAAVTA